MTDLTDTLKTMLAEQGESPEAVASTVRTGRSGSGNLRNFGAMKDEKLMREAAKVEAENNDPEAQEAIRAEKNRRGL